MKKLMTTIAVIAVAAAVMAAPAEARGGWGGSYHGGGYYYDLAAAPGLNLTEAQAGKLNAVRNAHLREVKPLQDQMYSKSGDLRLLWLQRTPDQQKILTVQKEVRALRDQLYDKQTAYRLEAQKVLTPEQQAMLQNYGPRQAYGSGMGYGRGHGMRMGY